MRPILVLLSLLVFMLGLSALILGIPEPINGHAMAHHAVDGMRQVGDIHQQSDPVFGAGYLLGVLIYLVISVLVCLGVQPAKRDRTLVLAHTAATLLVLGVWSLLMYLFRQYLLTGDPMIVFGFPLPTLVMLLGVWIAPMSFSLIYILGFRRWVFTPEDEKTFRELLESKRS
ncbi:MAG: hypothetical protein OXI88_10335 [Gammaproteobacteria bacterium]|nr:hypothetical protein [Gammaproteobacteria bacterium]